MGTAILGQSKAAKSYGERPNGAIPILARDLLGRRNRGLIQSHSLAYLVAAIPMPRGFRAFSPIYRRKPTLKLNISCVSPGFHATGKAKSNAIGAGPIAGTVIRRPKPGATRYLSCH